MKTSQTAVLERGIALDGELVTEPFEVAWAGEARWFVQQLEPASRPDLAVAVQVSPDGLTWVDHEEQRATSANDSMMTGTARSLGSWLRLRVSGRAELIRIYLALKE